MIKKIKSFILSGTLLLAVAVPAITFSAPAVAASGACVGVPAKVAGGASDATGASIQCDATGGGDTATTALGDLAKKIVNIFSIVVGAAAIIMIVYGGFRYITSGGSSERVGSAKNTLIYAIIGLIIVGLAQILVHFVLSQATSTGGSFG